MTAFDMSDPGLATQLRQMFGPGHIDEQIRQTMRLCWMLLPDDRRTVDELERQFRRIVDRALADLKADAATFGIAN